MLALIMPDKSTVKAELYCMLLGLTVVDDDMESSEILCTTLTNSFLNSSVVTPFLNLYAECILEIIERVSN